MPNDAIDTGGGSDAYNPALAQLMRISPGDVGNLSLVGLGQRAMGGDNPEYQDIMAKISAAQENLNKALAARSTGLDPKYLALATGLLNPGGGGGFFEGLGKGMQGYQAAAYEEDKRNRDIAQAQLALQQQKLAQLSQQAGLGLQVSKALAPGITALQRQALAENPGMLPNDPVIVKRVKELQSLTNATPDTKDAATYLGKSVSDITPDDYQRYLQDKNLIPLATSMGLDLKDPKQRRAVQIRSNYEENLTKLNDRQKFYLAQIKDGDPTNPEHMKQVADKISQESNLDLTSKAAQIARDRAQAQAAITQDARARQELSQNTINGNPGPAIEKAKQLGVPAPNPTAVAPGLSPLQQQQKNIKDSESFRQHLDKVSENVDFNKLDESISNTQKAIDIIKKTPTGGITSLIPGANTVRDALDSNRQLMQKYSNLSINSVRPAGMSRMTNMDLGFLQKSTYSPTSNDTTNLEIAQAQLAQMKLMRNYLGFMNNAYTVGHSRPDAENYWGNYLSANPVVVKDKSGNTVPNPTRMEYQQYFTAPRKQYDSKGNEIPQGAGQ
jgi:hypothetical protein